MTITNGYLTLAQFKAALRPDATPTTSSADDSFIESVITRASRYIDTQCNRHFYAATLTKYYNVPSPTSRALTLDDDLLTVSTLTNGDGTVLTIADYYLAPRNEPAKYQIFLKESSSYSWEWDSNGNTEGVISVAGTWGYVNYAATDTQSVIVIEAVTQACLSLSMSLYRARAGQGVDGLAEVTAAGVVISPRDVPEVTRAFIETYRRHW